MGNADKRLNDDKWRNDPKKIEARSMEIMTDDAFSRNSHLHDAVKIETSPPPPLLLPPPPSPPLSVIFRFLFPIPSPQSCINIERLKLSLPFWLNKCLPLSIILLRVFLTQSPIVSPTQSIIVSSTKSPTVSDSTSNCFWLNQYLSLSLNLQLSLWLPFVSLTLIVSATQSAIVSPTQSPIVSMQFWFELGLSDS